eukprot:3215788-Prymnesium_polylepis.1
MGANKPLQLTLRPRANLPAGVAPAGVLRDRQAEKRRAIANATKKALAAAPPTLKLEYTAARKGEATAAYTELALHKPLPIIQVAPVASLETASHRQRRLAAASRWQKARLLGTATSTTPAQRTPLQVAEVRQVRRGEFEGLTGVYRQYEVAELLDLVHQVRSKSLKVTEMRKAYDEGRHRVPPKTVED